MVCSFIIKDVNLIMTNQETGDQVLCVLASLNNTRSPTMISLTSYIYESNKNM